MKNFFNSKFCKVFEKYWRLVMFIMGMVLSFASVIQHDTTLNLCAVECFIIILIPHIVNDTMKEFK